MPQPLQKQKRILNEIPQAVDDALIGLAMCNRGLVVMEGQRVVLRRDHLSLQGKVKLLSGSGGGHNPGQSGFVGPGMLTAAIVGDIFRPPQPCAILKTIRELGIGHPEGVLIIILNYMGDRLNFGLAIERARSENIKVRLLVVGDDCSVANPTESAGRRGLAGIIFVLKIAGAMAQEGRTIDEIYNTCRGICVSDLATMGIALRAPIVPGSTSHYRIADDEIELGIGLGILASIQNIPVSTADLIIQTILDQIFANSPSLASSPNPEVAVLINNMGGSCLLEEGVFTMETLQQLAARGVVVRRVYYGSFVTALDTSGMSLTLFHLKSPGEILKLLDSETSVPGWPRNLTASCVGNVTEYEFELPVTCASQQFPEFEKRLSFNLGPRISMRDSFNIQQVIRFSAEAVMSVAMTLNTLDAESGDADCGSNVKKGCQGILEALNSHAIETSRPYATLEQLCSVSEHSMCGTSGALYSIFFAAAAAPFSKMAEDAKVDERAWLNALLEGIEAIQRYGMAQKGDRTMLEPLIAAEAAGRVLIHLGETDCIVLGTRMADAAELATADTVTMAANSGHACYVLKQPLKMPDAGAFCAAVWIRAVSEAIKLFSSTAKKSTLGAGHGA